MKPKTLQIADLFCGAGGSSAGAIEAVRLMGYEPQLTAVNHWNRATDTMLANHPEARVLCTGVDNINPRDLWAENELDVLTASPECTHFSNARGGRPVNEQSRGTAMCIIRWAETMRPPVIMIENVSEFRTWGPLIRKRIKGKLEWVPDPARKGELFRAWILMLEATGYIVDHRLIVCADNGDPTTRKRLFIQAVRPPRKICWPNATHSEEPDEELFSSRRSAWATARDDVIDWSIQGRWIDEMPGKARYGGLPLSPNTLRRVHTGFFQHGVTPFIVPQMTDHPARSIDRPLPTIKTTSRGVRLIEPFIVNNKGKSNGASIRKPMPTQTSHASHLYLAEPFIVKLRGTNKTGSSIDMPLPTVTGSGRNLYLAEPFLVSTAHGVGKKEKYPHGRRVHSISKPVPTIMTSNNLALIEPCLLPQQSGGRLRPVSEPMPTIATKGAIALIEPYLVEYFGTASSRSVNRPFPTLTTKHRLALVCPAIEIDGQKARVRYRYRMVQWHELALGQGFKREHLFVGNITEKVKMIGNAVPRKTMRALILAAWGQDPDVAKYFLNDKELAA